MSLVGEAVPPVNILSPADPEKSGEKDSIAESSIANEKSVEQVSEDCSSEVVLVDYEENDPANPLNWKPARKWFMVFAVSWMSFVSVFATMTITPTAPQILEEFHSHSVIQRTLLVSIWELGEGVGPFFIAPLSERFGRVIVFHIGNFLALICLISCALSVNIPMLIVFRFLTGCCLSILTLGPAIVGDLFEMEQSGKAMAMVMCNQILPNFIAPVAGSYIAQNLGWRWSIWLAAIVLGTFSFQLLVALRETYAVVILRRKAQRLQAQSRDGKQYRSKHQAHVDKYTPFQIGVRPLIILAKSPILILAMSFMAVTYGMMSLLFATLTETMEASYPHVFNSGSIGLTFLSLAIGITLGLVFYTFTSDRYVVREKAKKGDAYKPETRLVHLLLAVFLLPCGFLLYGWTLQYRVQYIVPLIGTTLLGFCMLLSNITPETYVVDIYKIHGASAIAGGVFLRAILGAFLPLIGPPLYQSIGYGWGNSVVALIGAIFIPLLGSLWRYGDWWRSKDRFGNEPK